MLASSLEKNFDRLVDDFRFSRRIQNRARSVAVPVDKQMGGRQ
jgi:hypothetical protein